MITATATCPHSDLHFHINHNHFADTNVHSLDLSANCNICGVRMKFLGLPIGVSMAKPTVCAEGFEGRFPIIASDEIPDSKLGAFLTAPTPPAESAQE